MLLPVHWYKLCYKSSTTTSYVLFPRQGFNKQGTSPCSSPTQLFVAWPLRDVVDLQVHVVGISYTEICAVGIDGHAASVASSITSICMALRCNAVMQCNTMVQCNAMLQCNDAMQWDAALQ